ncbi:MAG: hypothetical protein AB7L84_09805 [Acidimicrobiia bacterium]
MTNDDEVFEVSLDGLKIREIEEIEEIISGPIGSAFAEGKPQGKVLRAIAYVVKRRSDPDFTLEDAGELVVKFPEPEPAADPTDAAVS